MIDLNRSPTENLLAVAEAKGESVRNVTAVILDRDRHDDLIAEVREAGARIRLIPDGDVAGAISTAWSDSGADILFGIGGTPEGVISAAALKCMGGEILGRLWPRDDAERAAAVAAGYDLDRVLDHRRPGRRRQLLLRRHRHHRRRAAQGRPLRPARGHHPVAGHAVPLGHGAHDQRPPQPVEAGLLQRHRVRLTPARPGHASFWLRRSTAEVTWRDQNGKNGGVGQNRMRRARSIATSDTARPISKTAATTAMATAMRKGTLTSRSSEP